MVIPKTSIYYYIIRMKNTGLEKNLLHAVFAVVEFINKAELPIPGKRLIMSYFDGAGGDTSSAKAREAIIRHTGCRVLPALADLRNKTVSQLDKLDHLVLKVEFEAKKLDDYLLILDNNE